MYKLLIYIVNLLFLCYYIRKKRGILMCYKSLTIDKFNEINMFFYNKYSSKILSLKNKYLECARYITVKQFRKLNELYRIYIEDLIYNIIVEFKKYYDIDFCVTLNGSLARHSNNLFSDIDINYLTSKNDYKKVIDIEDKVNYILQNVLQFRGKDRIHSMVVYLPLVSNKKLDYMWENKYPVRFIDGTIYNSCRSNAEKLMYETYNSTRSLYDVINYFNENDTISKLNEWAYCFKFVYNEELNRIYNNKRVVCRQTEKINSLIINLIDKISLDNDYLSINQSEVRNSDLKKIYKSTVLFNFYELLAIFFRIDKNIENFDLDDFYKNSVILDKKIFYYFNKYLMLIQNIQIILDMKNMDLSSHSNSIIDINYMNKMYLRLVGRNNILSDLN